MSEIKLDIAECEAIKSKLMAYCEEHFELELEQFDAEFFTDFVIDPWGRPARPVTPAAPGADRARAKSPRCPHRSTQPLAGCSAPHNPPPVPPGQWRVLPPNSRKSPPAYRDDNPA